MDQVHDILPDKDTSRLLALAFATSPGAITISRLRDGRYLFVNEGFAAMSGWPEDQVVGRTSLDLRVWYDGEERRRFIQHLLCDRQVHSMACRFRRRSGEVFSGHMSASLFDVNGESHVFAVTLDISDVLAAQRRAEASETRLRGLVAHLPHGLCETDLCGTILMGNRALATLLDVAVPGLTGRRLFDLVADAGDARHLKALFDDFDPAGGCQSGTLTTDLGRADGSRVRGRLDWTRQPPPAEAPDDLPTLVFVVTDITPTVRARDELERSVDELTRSNVDLERYAYIAAHDLREPIRTVTSYAQLLRRRLAAAGQLQGETGELFDYLENGARRMNAVVDDLLTYSRLQSGAEPFERVDLNDILAVVRANLARTIQDQGAEVSSESPLPVVTADGPQMAQLFQNLVANGLRYQPREEGHVPCVVLSPRRQADGWAIAVRDNGIGIEEQYFSRVFQLFQRLHSQREYAGTGVGLAICKRITERHGGALALESEPGRGSVFTVWLPDAPPDGHAASATPAD